MDKYRNFRSLQRNESAYTIDICDRSDGTTILAPHGGLIEPHTSEIARLIAADRYNFFCFNGEKEKGNQDLNITSHRYDKEEAIALVEKSTTVVTVHGCSQKKPIIYIGGLDKTLMQNIAAELTIVHIANSCLTSTSLLQGTNKRNICNRGITGEGVQLEISRPLRDSETTRQLIARAVQNGIDKRLAKTS